MDHESCGVCGGDGRIGNAFGLTDRCPSCKGSGKRDDSSPLMHDVTKTKPSHHRQSNKSGVVVKKQWPDTFEGGRLATEVRDSSFASPEVKTRLIREIIEHEDTHATCTQTFQRKVRKQLH
jgi:hypothetical protein